MSLIPYILSDFTRPTIDQQDGLGAGNDVCLPYITPITSCNRIQHHSRKTSTSDTKSVAHSPQNNFEINLDVQQFAPEEITVKVNGNGFVIVEAKHDEKEDEHGYVFRHFVRRYPIPHGVNMDEITCSLSSDRILKLTAPEFDRNSVLERIIPIKQTGVPSTTSQNAQF